MKRLNKADIQEMETVTGSDHNLPLIVWSLKQTNFCKRDVLGTQTTERTVWKLDSAKQEDWENYQTLL